MAPPRKLSLLLVLPLVACSKVGNPVPEPSGVAPPGEVPSETGAPPIAGTPPDAGNPPDAGPAPQRDAGVPHVPDAGPIVEQPPPKPKPKPEACPGLFADMALPTFELELAPAEWAALQKEHTEVEARMREGLELEPYHPVLVFRHADREVRDGAMIRLRGNPLWWPSQNKMQLQISFNELDSKGRFRGLRKIVLDSGHYNRTYLRDRLAMSVLRDLGLPAPCVNHARLVVNGQFYGLFTHIEKVDREFLERNFADPDGNLYKKGLELKTNEEEQPDTSRADAFWDTTDVAALEKLGDLDEWVRVWAVEALLPDADGYWAGGWNFYLYDDPERGFVYVPWDFDLGFDNLPADTDPLTWHKANDRFNGRPHVEAVLADPKWRKRFIEHVAWARRAYEPSVLQARIDAWAAQIEQQAQADVLAPWSFEEHRRGVRRLRQYVEERARFIDGWLERQRDGADAGP